MDIEVRINCDFNLPEPEAMRQEGGVPNVKAPDLSLLAFTTLFTLHHLHLPDMVCWQRLSGSANAMIGFHTLLGKELCFLLFVSPPFVNTWDKCPALFAGNSSLAALAGMGYCITVKTRGKE